MKKGDRILTDLAISSMSNNGTIPLADYERLLAVLQERETKEKKEKKEK